MRGIRLLGASVGLGLAALVLLVCVSIPAPPISRGAALRGPDQSAVIQTTRNISPSIPGSAYSTSIDSLLQSDVNGEQTAAILLPECSQYLPGSAGAAWLNHHRHESGVLRAVDSQRRA